MKNATRTLLSAVATGIVMLAACSSPESYGTIKAAFTSAEPVPYVPPPVQSEYVPGHEPAIDARTRLIEWADRRSRTLYEHGMEPGRAGIHLLRPVPDYWHNWSERSGDFWFWSVATAYIDGAYIPNGLDGDGSAIVSYRRIIQNKLGYEVRIVTAPSGLHNIELEFDAKDILRVKAVTGPQTSASEFTDWYGVPQPANGSATPMNAVVVSNNTAYHPFSLHDIATGTAPYVIVAASELEWQEAVDIARVLDL